MPDEIRVTVDDESRLDEFEARFDETMTQVVISLTERVATQAQRNAPRDTGVFAGSIQPLIEQPAPLTISGFVVSSVAYAGVIEGVDEEGNEVEFGRRPGARFPPVGKIRLWVERKIGVDQIRARAGKTARTDEQLIDETAFLVGRKIARQGIRPTRPIGNAFRANESLIRSEIEKAITRIFE
ncbi:MAG: hypothetical protein L0229_22555 [Blastocatellia bacterium]|nr:hypothetical protein [Blastocatellia bacterium]